ncbi:MAG: MFS transporter, partial [Methanoregula sp.]|nr:MFS transporter [Methanoregula sp.]
LNVPLGIATILLTLMYITHEWADAEGEQFDLRGSVIYGAMLFSGIFGLLLLPDPAGIAWILGGIIAAAFFVWWQTQCSHPILDLGIFRANRTFTFSNIAAMINYGATFGVGFLLSLYLQYIRGFSAETAGLILVAQPIVQTILSPVAGRISDRVEPQVVATIGMGITTLGLSFFIFLGPDTPLFMIIGALMVLGLGYAFFSSPNTNAIMSSVDKRYLGIASGMVATMRSLGQVLSMAIAMICFSVLIGSVTVTPSVYPALMESTTIAFFIFTILCVMGVAASYVRGTIHADKA